MQVWYCQLHFHQLINMSQQLKLFDFGISGKVSSSKVTVKAVKGRKPAQLDYESKRTRKFVSTWNDTYPGVFEEDSKLYCCPCITYKSISDPTSTFVTGSDSYRVGGLNKHWKSEPHRKAANKHAQEERQRQGLETEGPMDVVLQQLNAQNKDILLKLFNTIYYVLKYEEPFVALPKLINLQVKNGSDLSKLISYNSHTACKRYVFYHFIFET